MRVFDAAEESRRSSKEDGAGSGRCWAIMVLHQKEEQEEEGLGIVDVDPIGVKFRITLTAARSARPCRRAADFLVRLFSSVFPNTLVQKQAAGGAQ